MTSHNGSGTITTTILSVMRRQLEEAAAIARRPRRVPWMASRHTIALDVEQLAVEANQLLQSLAIVRRVGREERDQHQNRVVPREVPAAPKRFALSA